MRRQRDFRLGNVAAQNVDQPAHQSHMVEPDQLIEIGTMIHKTMVHVCGIGDIDVGSAYGSPTHPIAFERTLAGIYETHGLTERGPQVS